MAGQCQDADSVCAEFTSLLLFLYQTAGELMTLSTVGELLTERRDKLSGYFRSLDKVKVKPPLSAAAQF